MDQRSKYIKQTLFILFMFLLLIFAVMASLAIGEVSFTPSAIFKILTKGSGIEYTILNNIRLPRIILGIAVGGALSLSGVILQGVYRNPLVEPYTLGISGGASLGVAVTIIFNLSTVLGIYMLPLSGFTGAVITTFLVYVLAVRKNYYNINRMLLIGVMISFMASSTMMFLMATTTTQNLNSIIFWIMGSLDETNTTLVKIVFYTSVAGLIISYLLANPLNALRLGESKAKHLGVNTSFTIKILFIVASVLTGISVSVAGVIGFVGLIIPHLLRMIIGSDHRLLLISSFLGGSIFILISDIIARTIIAPNELPIGVITGMVGGFIFIIVMSRSKMKV
jgi:iron complex transport system permease protein